MAICWLGLHRWIEGECAGGWHHVTGKFFCTKWVYTCQACGVEEVREPVAEAYGRI